MKFKQKLFLGLLGSTSATFVTALLSTSCSTATISTVNSVDNSSYATLLFVAKDEDVTFTGNTKIKVRVGKTFGSIVPPKAYKPNAEFKYWVTMIKDEETILQPSTIIEEDLYIVAVFEGGGEEGLCHIQFDGKGCDFPEGYQEVFVKKGTIFDDVPKPKAIPNDSYMQVIGWTDGDGEPILPTTVINSDEMVVFPLINSRYKYYEPIGRDYDFSMSLNFTATSDNASVTWIREGDYGKGQLGIGYFRNFGSQIITQNSDERIHEAISIPNGETVSIMAGDLFGPRPEGAEGRPHAFSIGEEDYSHFVITGDVWVSGSINGLLCSGFGPNIVGGDLDSLNNFTYERGGFCFYKLFENADSLSPNSHLHIAQDISSQDYPFLASSILSPYCYANMFDGCNITSIPNQLLAPQQRSDYYSPGRLTLAEGCYMQMFQNCQKLKTIPEDIFYPCPQIEMELYSYCFSGMFKECTGLEFIPSNLFDLFVNIRVIASAFYQLFYGCSRLTIYRERYSYQTVLILNTEGWYIDEGEISEFFAGCNLIGGKFEGQVRTNEKFYLAITHN